MSETLNTSPDVLRHQFGLGDDWSISTIDADFPYLDIDPEYRNLCVPEANGSVAYEHARALGFALAQIAQEHPLLCGEYLGTSQCPDADRDKHPDLLMLVAAPTRIAGYIKVKDLFPSLSRLNALDEADCFTPDAKRFESTYYLTDYMLKLAAFEAFLAKSPFSMRSSIRHIHQELKDIIGVDRVDEICRLRQMYKAMYDPFDPNKSIDDKLHQLEAMVQASARMLGLPMSPTINREHPMFGDVFVENRSY